MFLWVAGLILLTVCMAVGFRMHSARQAAEKLVPESKESGPADLAPGQGEGWAVIGGVSPRVVGRVEIPSIGLVTPLLAGDDSTSLSEGAGHIPGTAYPGGLGTVGIAGHRDTHFRQLRKAARGMDVQLTDRIGTYHYRVSSTEIVTPDKVSVLDIQSTPGLVLITCYPFSYIGKAPKRFVVHAELISVAPDDVKR
jgi:sortase A